MATISFACIDAQLLLWLESTIDRVAVLSLWALACKLRPAASVHGRVHACHEQHLTRLICNVGHNPCCWVRRSVHTCSTLRKIGAI
jgi:hypothetical protein